MAKKSTKQVVESLTKIVEIIDSTPGYSAEIGDDYYLIRFGRIDDEDVCPLVLMYDCGVTYEPIKDGKTPNYGYVDIKDPQPAAKHLMAYADSRHNETLRPLDEIMPKE